MNSTIKNIVFDFGGVLLDIDYTKTFEQLYHLTGLELSLTALPQHIHSALALYETGKIGTESFLWQLQHLSQKGIPDARKLIDAWNAMLIGWNPAHFSLLTALHHRYRLFLLSNTNALHLDWVYRDLADNHGITQFDKTFFDQTFYSHLEGFRKPDPAFFQHVTTKADLISEKTLFIDDLQANVIAATSFGWNTYQHNPGDDLSVVLKERLRLL